MSSIKHKSGDPVTMRPSARRGGDLSTHVLADGRSAQVTWMQGTVPTKVNVILCIGGSEIQIVHDVWRTQAGRVSERLLCKAETE